MSQSNPKYFLRPEAGPIPWGKLQRRAKAALKDIIGFISAAVSSAQVSSEDDTIDTNRASRIFFVSGEPGSGKSTLYLTLKAMLSTKEETSKKYCKDCDKDGINLGNLKEAVRWLDTLDLEVAGDEGENLLAAVLVRLIAALTKPGTNTILSKPCEEAIKDLEELATDIGIAWAGNLQARAGALDPDTYSEEVMRTQRARLGVNERLKEALDKLAKNECYGCRQSTIFVLPVDDFYLKPDASLQLLRLLRMISIPRLFFLVMGDIKTIEALFVEKSLKDWTAVAGPEVFATLQYRQDEALARARELRARYLRKLLPPGQRAEIEAMDWDEALNFKPERLNGKEVDEAAENIAADTPIVGTLKNFLEKENLDSSADESSLLTFLISPPFEANSNGSIKTDNDDETAKKKRIRTAQESYTALQILDATSREIMDLWFALYELKTRKSTDAPALLSCVLGFVKLVIEEQDFLNEEQQGVLSGVLPTRHYTEQEIYLDMDRLRLGPEQNTWNEQTRKDLHQESDKTPERLWVRKHRSWKLGLKTDEAESEGEVGLFGKLPPRQTAWIVLLHDLAWTWKSERVTGNLVKKLCGDLDTWSRSRPKAGRLSKGEDNTEVTKMRIRQLVKILETEKSDEDGIERNLSPLDDFLGWAVLLKEETYHHFPMPDLETFRELDHFLHIWNSGLDWVAEPPKEYSDSTNDPRGTKQENHTDDKPDSSEDPVGSDDRAQELAKGSVEKRERDGLDTSPEINSFLSIWSLAGWTVLADRYEDFVAGGDEWFKDFAGTTGTFKERFSTFKDKLKEKGIVFENASEKEAKIIQWSENLNKWPKRSEEKAGDQEDHQGNDSADKPAEER